MYFCHACLIVTMIWGLLCCIKTCGGSWKRGKIIPSISQACGKFRFCQMSMRQLWTILVLSFFTTSTLKETMWNIILSLLSLGKWCQKDRNGLDLVLASFGASNTIWFPEYLDCIHFPGSKHQQNLSKTLAIFACRVRNISGLCCHLQVTEWICCSLAPPPSH